MRIVSWNCQSGFDKKWDELLSLKPDIAVIQEVTEKAFGKIGMENDYRWLGAPGKKGLAVIVFGKWKIEPLPKFRPIGSSFLPVKVSLGKVHADLVGVWTKSVKGSNEDSYAGQAFDFVAANAKKFSTKSIFTGDLNASTKWDAERRVKTFSSVIAKLQGLGLESLYHRLRSEKHSAESSPTIFMYRHFHDLKKSHHIDYCFAGKYWLKRARSVKVVRSERWEALSDHLPLVCDFSLN